MQIIVGFVIWGFIHSLLASLGIKEFAREILGRGFMRIYRLTYNAFSFASFLPILWLTTTLPNRPLYSASAPWSYIMLVGQGLGALGVLVAVLQTDILYFMGLKQLYDEEKPGRLVTSGLYRFVRHPIYTFSLLFLWLTPTMTVNLFVFYICATIYFMVGAWFEERKLLREFGSSYAKYRSVTPMLIPGLILPPK